MKTPEPGRWQRTSPFAVLFFFGKVIRLIMKNAWQSLAPLLAIAVARQGDLVETATIAAVALSVFVGGAAVLRYWFFRFQLNPDAILIRQGVIKKSQLNIRFDRIQGINTEQNIVFRKFGLVTMSFDTAGSAADEGNLPAVPRDFADDLRRRIGRCAPGVDAATEQPATDVLLKLDWRDMIRIGLSDKRALIGLALLGPIFERFDESIGRSIDELVRDSAAGDLPIIVVTGAPLVAAIIVAVILVLVLISIGAAFWRYHGFELVLPDGTLRSTGGLVTRHEVSMNLGKIQTLRLQQGLVLRGFRRFRMTARQARAGRKQDSDKSFTIPVVTDREANHLRELMFAEEGRDLVQIPTSDLFQRVSPYFMRTPIMLNALAAIAVTAMLAGLSGQPGTLVILAWIPLSALVAYQSWRHAGYLLTDEGFVRRSGIIGYRTVALLYRKVQRVTVTQSPLQRRKGLATLRVYMASGSVRIPYVPGALARQLRDFILYKVESSRKAWY